MYAAVDEIELWEMRFQKNDDDYVLFTHTEVASTVDSSTGVANGYSVYTYSVSMDLIVGDVIRVYGKENANVYSKIVIWGTDGVPYRVGGVETYNYPNLTSYSIPSYMDVTGATVTPNSQAQGFFLHDVFAAVVERIVGRNAFYSEVLGSTVTNSRQYNSNGCHSNHVLMKGLHIRGYTLEQKKFFASFDELWNGANPIFNLGLGYETIDGEQMIQVEQKSYFFE